MGKLNKDGVISYLKKLKYGVNLAIVNFLDNKLKNLVLDLTLKVIKAVCDSITELFLVH